MAIKDEVYVAWLLSSDEKYEADRDRYNVRPELGDKMIHRHLNRPEFTFGNRTLRFKLRTRPWMLKLMRHGKFLRRLLPAWHATRKSAFRQWYFDLADQFSAPIEQPPPTPRGWNSSASPKKPPATAKSAIQEWPPRSSRAAELLASLTATSHRQPEFFNVAAVHDRRTSLVPELRLGTPSCSPRNSVSR